MLVGKSKISKRYQVVVPSKIRKALNLKPGDILPWKVIDGKLTVEIIKDTTKEILDSLGKVGMGPTNPAKDIDEVVNSPE